MTAAIRSHAALGLFVALLLAAPFVLSEFYVTLMNYIGLATLVKEGMYLTGQTKVSLIVYLSAYTLSLAAFLGIILRQTQLPEWLLYTALLGIWAALTGWFAHAALRASSADPASR